MKRKLLLLATTLAIHSAALAQTKVPSLINYQGHITTSAGAVIGAGSSVNRNVTFRFWTSATDTAAASRLYSETQLVTILNGDFSVLIGSGTTVIGEVKPAMATVFANKEVFLGITVDDGNDSTTDVEVTPRQQLVSTAFAFRASVAESVDNAAITTAMLANNAVTTTQVNDAAITTSKIAANAVTTTQITNATITGAKIATDTIVAGNIQAGAVGTSEILDGTIATADIANLAVTNAKIATDTILAGNIAAGAVSTSELAAGSVTYDKLAASNQLTVNTTGVGIGTTAPGFPLNFGTVLGDKIALWGNSGSTYGFGVQGSLLQIHTDASGGDIAFGYGSSAAMTETMRIKGTGNVGIGTNSPTQAKLVVSGGVVQSSLFGPYIATGGYGPPVFHGAHTMSIYGSGGIWTGDFFIASSDVRIKNISGVSDGAADLGTLMGIEVTNYSYKDVISKGNSEQKKLIAQQVETVFPQAVSKRTDVVPDIYQKAALNDGWIKLPTDLKKGDRVKLISKNEEGVHEVLEVAAGKFRTAFTGTAEEVFVYGREVNDFRTVDYDAISMLNVSATQELKREVDVLRAENARLRNVLEARLSALEQGRSEGATVPVSASHR